MGACLAISLLALGAHGALASAGVDVPWLTLCVVLGLVSGQFPVAQRPGLQPGVSFAGRTLMRVGIVLLGLHVQLADVFGLGPVVIVGVVAVLVAAFVVTYALARVAGLPGNQPILMAAGFSICGASAIGAMGEARGASAREQATPIALVTLCGTAAIAILPLVRLPLGLSDADFGIWAGASVHDVGQVVATASVVGPAALAIAVIVKLVRVLCLAPMVLAQTLASRSKRRHADGKRPPLVPVFVLGFCAAIALGNIVQLPTTVLDAAEFVQQLVLGTALVAVLSRVRLAEFGREEARAVVVAVASSLFIATAALGLIAVA